MYFESKIVSERKTTQCSAYGLTKNIDTCGEPEHTLTIGSGETITIQVLFPHDEIRTLTLSAQGAVVMLVDQKTDDAFLVRRSKNIANIGEEVLVGKSQIV